MRINTVQTSEHFSGRTNERMFLLPKNTCQARLCQGTHTWVASQMVLKLMKCSWVFSTPYFCSMVLSISFPAEEATIQAMRCHELKRTESEPQCRVKFQHESNSNTSLSLIETSTAEDGQGPTTTDLSFVGQTATKKETRNISHPSPLSRPSASSSDSQYPASPNRRLGRIPWKWPFRISAGRQ